MSVNSQKCPICSESIETMYSLHSHCIEKHPRRFVCCPICFQPLKNSQSNRDLVKHSNFLHRRKTKKEYNSVDYAPNASYRFGEHMLQDKSCVICSKDFSNHKQVTKHIREIHLAIKYLCNQCPKTFSKLTHLKNHHSTKHGHGSNTKSAAHAGLRTTKSMNAKVTYKPQAEPKQRTAIRAGIKIFRCPPTLSNPCGLSCTTLGTECKSTDCADFKVCDKMRAEKTLNSRLSTEKSWRKISVTGPGIKILDDLCEVVKFSMIFVLLPAIDAIDLRDCERCRETSPVRDE